MQPNPFTIGQVRAFWDAVAPVYDRINATMGWTHCERFLTMQKYLPIQSGLAILNVWSRTGSAVPFIRERCPQATLLNLEVSGGFIKRAQERYPTETFEQTDLHDLPCATESQDIIVSLETLEHVPDPLHFLLECHRVLKTGGRLILSCPPAWNELPLRIFELFGENHGEGPHRFPKVRTVLKAMRQCGFTIMEHRGTVLLPLGPEWMKKIAEAVQQSVLRYVGGNALGIRHFYIAEKRETRDPVWAKIAEEILRPGLDTHSGTCVGLSEGTLKLDDPDGTCRPVRTGKGPVPAICYEASPEVRPSYPYMNANVFGTHTPLSLLLGDYRRLAVGHCTDERIRRNGASGGILTGILLHLLRTKKITGAVVLRMDPAHPWRAVPTIARTEEEILDSAQSKYVVSPVNTILDRLGKEEGPLAYVGLPHQVFAIRRLQQLHHPSVRPIEYIFGPFFGNELSGSAIESFLRRNGARKEDIASLAYRTGEWPGHMEIRLKDGRAFRMPKFHANYLIPFHITRNSLLSHDLTNEFTDLSGGDAWSPVYEERGKGFSLVIIRSQKAEALVREMEESGLLALKDLSEDQAISMQSHGIDFKKRGAFLRIERLKRSGQRYPEYGLTLTSAPWKRRAFEWMLDDIFTVCAWGWVRAIADRIPNRLMGPFFERVRTVWKHSTRSTKRAGVSSIALAITD